MRIAKKKIGRRLKAYELGASSPMELRLLNEKKIIANNDDTFSLLSLEAVKGGKGGEVAHNGDFFKVDFVDGNFFPYPNAREWFLKNHIHLTGDDWEQIPKPLPVWFEGDDLREPEMNFLIHSGKLFIKKDDPKHYFNAFLWGTWLASEKSSAIVFYQVNRDSAGEIFSVDFGLVQRKIFERDYEFCTDESRRSLP